MDAIKNYRHVGDTMTLHTDRGDERPSNREREDSNVDGAYEDKDNSA